MRGKSRKILAWIVLVSVIAGMAGIQTAAYAGTLPAEKTVSAAAGGQQTEKPQDGTAEQEALRSGELQQENLQSDAPESEDLQPESLSPEVPQPEDPAGAASEPADRQSEDLQPETTRQETQTGPEEEAAGLVLADGTVQYDDDDKAELKDPNTTYIIKGSGTLHKDGNYFTVPADVSSSDHPLTIILDNVNRSQSGKSPDSSYITIQSGNYVVIKLRGSNYIEAGADS